MQKNEVYDAEITGYTHEGLGLARIDGQAVFVSQAARGDKGRVRIVRVGANARYGIWESLAEPSSCRTTQECGCYPPCGGCDFRHIRYEEELRAKAERVSETLRRLGRIDLSPDRIIGAPQLNGWRNKAVYPVGWKNGEPVTGFFRARSHDIVPCERCPQMPESADNAAAALRGYLIEYSGEVRSMLWRQGSDGQELVCVASRTQNLPEISALIESLREKCPNLASIWLDYNPTGHGSDNRVLSGRGTLLWGSEAITTQAAGLRFQINPYAFWQVNHKQLENMLAVVREYAGLTNKETVLDLYCGAGVLGLSIAGQAQSVVGVEIVQDAVDSANLAARENGVENYRAYQGDACTAEQALGGKRPEVVLVDPPRKGLDISVMEALSRLRPERIVYVSCDPATLARDCKRLGETGYRARAYTVLDMFPRTANVECCLLLCREA